MRLTDGQSASDAEPFIRKVRLHVGNRVVQCATRQSDLYPCGQEDEDFSRAPRDSDAGPKSRLETKGLLFPNSWPKSGCQIHAVTFVVLRETCYQRTTGRQMKSTAFPADISSSPCVTASPLLAPPPSGTISSSPPASPPPPGTGSAAMTDPSDLSSQTSVAPSSVLPPSSLPAFMPTSPSPAPRPLPTSPIPH